jgi:pimeloyl-ACP methyl ester carboxylesterase
MRRGRPRRSTVVVGSALAVVGCLILLVLLAALIGRSPPSWVPAPVQTLAFEVRLAVAPPAKKLVTLSRMPLGGTRVYLDRLGRYPDAAELGLTVPGTLYRPEPMGPGPGILLLHGSTPEGRRMGLYRLLARMLAERGHTVLNIDHGSTGDAAAGLRLLGSLEDVAGDDLSIVGHSAGAAVALGLGIPDDRVARIVVIGPGVRVEERARTESEYFQRRQLRYGREPRVQAADTFPPSRLLEASMDYFSRPDHKPLLLIQGELEDADDRAFLRELHAAMAGPTSILLVAGADHYMNVLGFGPLVLYDQRAAEQLLTGVTGWLPAGSAAGCGAAGQPCDWPGIPLLVVLAIAAPAAGLAVLGPAVLFLRRRRRPERMAQAPHLQPTGEQVTR